MTKFYLSSSAAAAISPAFSAWTRTTEGDRKNMSPTKDGSALTNKSVWANTTVGSSQTALCRQYVSDALAAGISFTTSHQVSAQVRVLESATNDNIDGVVIRVKVIASDGSTLQATLITAAFGNTNEWSTSLANRSVPAAFYPLETNYTTAAGDYLVCEFGARITGTGSTVTGQMNFGSSAGSDLPVDETTTTALDPWFNIDTDCFPAAPSGQPTSKRFGGVPFMGAHGSGLQAPVRQWIRRASGLMTPQFATTQIWRPAHGIN